MNEGGHYYTIYYLSLAAGFDPRISFRNAVLAQMPDEVAILDAIYQLLHKWLPIQLFEKNFYVRLRAAQECDFIHKTLHALTGNYAVSECNNTRELLKKTEPGTVKFGLLLHRFGDTYAHSIKGDHETESSVMIENETKLYPTGRGHGPEIFTEGGPHSPDVIHWRIALYRKYLNDLFETLAVIAKERAHSSARLICESPARLICESPARLISKNKLTIFVDRLAAIKSLQASLFRMRPEELPTTQEWSVIEEIRGYPDPEYEIPYVPRSNADIEKEEIQIIRASFDLFDVPVDPNWRDASIDYMEPYTPEAIGTIPWAEYRRGYKVIKGYNGRYHVQDWYEAVNEFKWEDICKAVYAIAKDLKITIPFLPFFKEAD